MACTADRAILFLVAAALTACGDSDAVLCDNEAGVLNAGELHAEPADVRFSEIWRIGSSHEDEHLGFPLSAALSSDGRVAIPDFQLGELFIVEPDGGWRGSIARRGAGPGELSAPVAAVWDASGGLHVFDIGKPAILRFAPDLSYTDEEAVPAAAVAAIVASGELGWAGVQPSGALLLQPAFAAEAGVGTVQEALLRYPPGSGVPDTIAVASFPVVSAANAPPSAIPGWPRLTAHVGVDGRTVVAGESHEYRFAVLDPGGAVTLRVCAEKRGAPLTAAERGVEPPEYMEPLGAAFAAAAPAPSPAAVGRVVAAADGSLWIQRDRRDPYPDDSALQGMPGAVYDVFDAGGSYRRTLRLPPRARLQGALGDTIWVYETSELEDVSLVAYRVEPAGA